MVKTDNLNDFLSDLANAIREKEGGTDLINPQDFADKIRSLSGGGSSEGDSSSEIPEVIGLIVYEIGFGDGNYYSVCFYNQDQITDPTFEATFEDLVRQSWILNNDIAIENGRVFYRNKPLYHDCESNGFEEIPINPVLSSDKIEPRMYYIPREGVA